MLAREIKNCPVGEISAYIDCELPAERELELDLHFASCRTCNQELNEQKQFLRGLDATLRSEAELALPENFTRMIVANAEGSVAGLRRPRERYNAIFICAALALFALFVLGAQAQMLLEQIAAVGSFFAHVLYSFLIGLTIIIRAAASRSEFGPTVTALCSVIFAAFSLYVSRRMLGARRA